MERFRILQQVSFSSVVDPQKRKTEVMMLMDRPQHRAVSAEYHDHTLAASLVRSEHRTIQKCAQSLFSIENRRGIADEDIAAGESFHGVDDTKKFTKRKNLSVSDYHEHCRAIGYRQSIGENSLQISLCMACMLAMRIYDPILKYTTSSSPSTPSRHSRRTFPASRAPIHPPHARKSATETTSAFINFFSKSVWMTPAASAARMPRRIVQARASFSPAVKK